MRRGDSEYICSRWIALRNDSRTLQLVPRDVQAGAVEVEALCNRPLPEQASCRWGEDAGVKVSGTIRHGLWEVCARGPHRVWAALELAGRVARDTLTVVVPNEAPELVVGGYWEGSAPLGGEVQDFIRAKDWNLDSLDLELLDLDGLEFVDATWVVHDWVSEFQGHWLLTLRHTDGQPGLHEVRFRVGDGLAYKESNLYFVFE